VESVCALQNRRNPRDDLTFVRKTDNGCSFVRTVTSGHHIAEMTAKQVAKRVDFCRCHYYFSLFLLLLDSNEDPRPVM
jgi:hypothetical protein